MTKKKVVVLFGGQSSEHEVSRISASSVISHMNQEQYEIYPIGITKQGQWKWYKGDVDNIKDNDWHTEAIPAILSPDASQKGLLVLENGQYHLIEVDVVFPVLHGLYGEDGTVQGLLELAQIPYVGCGVLASSVGMDKVYTKMVVNQIGVRQADFEIVFRHEMEDIEMVVARIEQHLGYPCFIKPSNAGSSVGISKAKNEEQLIEGLKNAFLHDRKVLVEEFISGREVECAVKGNVKVQASTVGEIEPANEFYDFEAKYQNANSKLYIPARLTQEKIEEVKEKAIRIYQVLDCSGLSRVDFFVTYEGEEVVFNEINTLPGFTSISMYPKMWEASGVPYDSLIQELITLAIERHEHK